MMRNIKRILLGCIICVLLCGSSMAARAASDSLGSYVYDGAGILDRDDVEDLNEEADELARRTGWDVFVLTVDDAQGYSSQEYAELFFNEYASGEDGIVCLLDLDNREIYLATSGEAIRYMTDERIDNTLDYAYGYALDGDYEDALEEMLEYVSYYYKQGIPKGQMNYDTETGEYAAWAKPKAISRMEFIIALILGAAAAVVSMLILVGKYRLKLGVHKDGFSDHSSLHITYQNDRLINRFVTTRRIPRNPPPGGGGRGGRISSTHSGMGGGSFGGGGRRF